MAKRRKNRTKSTSIRTVYKKVKRSSGKRKQALFDTAGITGAMLYGAGREYVSDKIAPYSSMIPAGEIADEVGMGLLNYAVSKGKVPLVDKVPMARQVAKAGLLIEAARIGEYLSDKFMNKGTTTEKSNGGFNKTVF